MPITYDETGLKTQSLEEIIDERMASMTATLPTGFNLDKKSETYKTLASLADRELRIQEAIQAVDESSYRSSAKGTALDRNLEQTGHTRQGASESKVIVYAKGISGYVIPAQDLFASVEQTEAVFLNSESTTLGSLGTKAIDSLTQTGGIATATISGGHSYPLDSFIFVEGADQPGYNKLAQITAVTSTTFEYEVGATLDSPATGSITASEASPINMQSQEKGAISAPSGSLTNITSSSGGLERIENADDATLGRETETDGEARTRADETVSIAGGGFREAILAKLYNVQGVTQANVFRNVSGGVDADGRPDGCVECFVAGGDDEEVRLAVYNSVSDGIIMYGNNSATVFDSEGDPVEVGFSRLTKVRIYVDTSYVVNTDPDQGAVYPGLGDDEVKTAISNIKFEADQNVWPTLIEQAITSVLGVVSITTLKFDIVSPPINTDVISIKPTEYADIDTGDILVTSL